MYFRFFFQQVTTIAKASTKFEEIKQNIYMKRTKNANFLEDCLEQTQMSTDFFYFCTTSNIYSQIPPNISSGGR